MWLTVAKRNLQRQQQRYRRKKKECHNLRRNHPDAETIAPEAYLRHYQTFMVEKLVTLFAKRLHHRCLKGFEMSSRFLVFRK